MLSGSQGYCSMLKENFAAASDDVVLPTTLEVTADVPSWSVSKYRTRRRRMLDALRLASLV